MTGRINDRVRDWQKNRDMWLCVLETRREGV